MFEPEKNLRSLIMDNLPDDGISISALSRLLREKGVKMHRLELNGYIKALSDMQVLKVRDVKPSKVFSPSQQRRPGFYEVLGKIIRDEESDEDKRASLALYVLSRIFKRAIFDRELRMCGLIGAPNSKKASEKESNDAKLAISKSGMRIGTGDRALLPASNYASAYSSITTCLLIDLAGLKGLTSETTQKTLEEG